MQKRITSCYGMCALFVAVRPLPLFSSIFPELGEPTHRNYVALPTLPTETKRNRRKKNTARNRMPLAHTLAACAFGFHVHVE